VSQHAGIPDWALDGSFTANNPEKHRMQISRWSIPVTTAEVRELVRLFAAMKQDPQACPVVRVPETTWIVPSLIEHVRTPTYPCAVCGQFAFPKAGTRCYWCGAGNWAADS
jgi:hypothetical protein